jgi:uncharacterized protein
MEIQRKYMSFAEAGVKADEAVEKREVSGYASTFEPPERRDAYGDIVAPGAFSESIAKHITGERRIKLLSEHSDPIGPVLELEEDAKGLKIRARVTPTTLGNDVLALIKDGVVDSFSIGFWMRGYELLDTPQGQVRRITKAELVEVSAVAFPANKYATIEEVKAAPSSTPTAEQKALQAAFTQALLTLHTHTLEHA